MSELWRKFRLHARISASCIRSRSCSILTSEDPHSVLSSSNSSSARMIGFGFVLVDSHLSLSRAKPADRAGLARSSRMRFALLACDSVLPQTMPFTPQAVYLHNIEKHRVYSGEMAEIGLAS